MSVCWIIEGVCVAGTTFEQDFHLGILIRGVNGDTQTVVKSDNPALSPEMHNRTRKLRCSKVSALLR
jgi:hypothetical protein